MSEQYADQEFRGKVTLPRIAVGKILSIAPDKEVVGIDLPERLTDNPWSIAYGNKILEVNNNYVVAGDERYNLSLPLSSSMGNKIVIIGDCHWRIVQNQNDLIQVGIQSTTQGTLGYVESSNTSDCITLTCISANRWVAYPFSPGVVVI